MELSKAILTIHSKKYNFVFSAFDHMIIFGGVKNGFYVEKESFIFHHYEFCTIFVGLFFIIKTLAGDSTSMSGIFCKKENLTYSWECLCNGEAKVIKLLIMDSNIVIHEIKLTSIEFNDLPRLIGFLILPSLNLQPKYFSFFQYLSQQDLNSLLSLKSIVQIESVLMNFLQQQQLEYSQLEIFNCSILTEYHLDIIVAKNKILSFYNEKNCSTQENIKIMEDCD